MCTRSRYIITYIISFSWERYFTHLLTGKTAASYLKHSKVNLNPLYLQGRICHQLVAAPPHSLRKALRQ